MTTFSQMFFSFVLILTTISQAFSQPNDLKFERISIDDGLSQNNVTSIVQDRNGFMWFGTLDGLNKFDGYTFKVYKHIPSDPNSLSANTIATIYTDKHGSLWIGTMAGGLNKLDLRTEEFTHYMVNPNAEMSLSDNRVRAILADHFGNIWIGTRDGGLNYLNLQKGTVQHFRHDPQNPYSLSDDHVRVLVADQMGNLWIGTSDGGLNLLVHERAENPKPEAVKFISFQHDPGNQHSLSHNHVESLFEDSFGTLWVGTYGGGLDRVAEFDPQTLGSSTFSSLNESHAKLEFRHLKHDSQNPQTLSDNFIESIAEDHEGTLWIGTSQGGLNRFDPATETFVSYQYDHNRVKSISHNNVEIIRPDKSGNLWVGTWGGGLNKIDCKSNKFVHYNHDPNKPNSLSFNYVRSIVEDQYGYLWVGTSGGGLDRFDRKSGKVWNFREQKNNFESLSSDDVRAVRFDRQNRLWVGTYGGGLNRSLNTLPDDRNIRKHVRFRNYLKNSQKPGSLSSNFVWCIYEDTSGAIWVGTNGGLNKFNPVSETFKHFKHDPQNSRSLSHSIVRTIYQDRNETLWIGTYNGLNRLDPNTESLIRYFHDPQNPRSLSGNAIASIFEDSKGTLWIGTLGNGLNSFDSKSQTFAHYLEKDGLPNSFVHAILEDDTGNLWLSTNKGLSKFNPKEKRFRNYDVSDGLQSNEFNAGAFYRNSHGELFFGGISGFNSFFPDQVTDNPFVPDVAITGFRVFNKSIDFGEAPAFIKKIQLAHKHNFFSFEFAALDFTNPQKNQYAYMMEGFDSEWFDSGDRRFASYTNLDPGEYVFRVKGSNNDGIWNEEGTSIQVIITPPFWGTWWFRILGAASIIALLWAVYHSRVASLKREKIGQERFSKQLIEMQEKERKRIASELHDSLGQNLLVIKNSIEQSIVSAPKGRPTKELTELSSIASQTINEVREIAYNLHPHIIERLGLTKAVESIIRKVSQSTEITFSLEIDEINNLLSKGKDIHIYRIIQEGISNLIKHAHASEANIYVKKKKSFLNIQITDNGAGFDFRAYTFIHSQNQGFGLTGISERVKILKGEFIVESSFKNGTTLDIRIPI